MKTASALTALGAFALIAALTSSSAIAKTTRIAISKAAIATAFNSALSAVEIHMDNYGARHGTSWHKDRSYILLPDGSRHAVPISEYTFSVTKTRKLKYYVHDLNSSQITAHADGANIRLVISFESQGEEIIGKCVRRRFGKWKPCSLKMERDIHLNNSRLSVTLKPVAYRGGISYAANPKVRFQTDVHIANRLCRSFKGICGWIEGKIKHELTHAVESNVSAALNKPRADIAAAVKRAPALKGAIKRSWVVTDVASQGGNFVVTVRR